MSVTYLVEVHVVEIIIIRFLIAQRHHFDGFIQELKQLLSFIVKTKNLCFGPQPAALARFGLLLRFFLELSQILHAYFVYFNHKKSKCERVMMHHENHQRQHEFV